MPKGAAPPAPPPASPPPEPASQDQAAGAPTWITTRDGQIGTIDPSELASAFRAGARVSTDAEVEHQQLVNEAEETFGAAATPVAAAAGLARGLSLEASDVLLKKGAGMLGYDESKVARGLKGLEAKAPVTSALTEFGGNILPIIASGGGAAAAEATGRVAEKGLVRSAISIAGAPVEAAAALGRGAEKLGLKALGSAGEKSVLGRVAREVGGKAIAGATEGAVYGAGNAISQATLDDHDLTGEELLAAMGGAAKFGGLVGGVSAVPFAVGGEAVGALKRGATRIAEAAPEAATTLARSSRDLGEYALGRAKEAGSELVAKGRDLLDKALPGSGDDLLARADKGASELAAKHFDIMGASDDNAARATYGRKRFVAEADARLKEGPNGEPGGWRGVGRVLKDSGVIDVKEGLVASAHSPEELLPRIEGALEKTGQELGDLARQSTGKVKMGAIAEPLERIVGDLKNKAGFESIVDSLQGYKESLYTKFGAYSENGKLLIGKEIPVQELIEQRKALDDLVYKESKSLDPKLRVEFMRDMRRELKALERDAIVRGGVDAKKFDTLNHRYQALRIAQEATDDSVSRGAANRSLGATDYLSFIAGSSGGGPALGGAMALANKLARERGSAAAAVFLHDVAESGSLLSAAKKAGLDVTGKARALFDATEGVRGQLGELSQGAKDQAIHALQKLQDANALGAIADNSMRIKRDIGEVAGRIGKTVVGAARAASDVRRVGAVRSYMQYEHYEKRKAEVERVISNPEGFQQQLGAQMTTLASAAPAVADAIGSKAQQMAQYLYDKLPPGKTDPYSMTPLVQKAQSKQLGVAEMKWMRIVQVLDDPQVALHGVEDGSLSIDQAQALRACYPEIYGAMRLAIIKSVTERDPKAGPLPRDIESRLSILFDAPLRQTQTPEFMQALADAENATGGGAPEESGGGSAPKGPVKPIDMPSVATESQTTDAKAVA